AQDPHRRVEVAAGLLERPLRVHHPRRGRIAKLLHHRRRDLGHPSSSSSSISVTAAGAGSGPLAPPAPAGGASSARVTCSRPAATASAITRVTSEQDRIASSFPGIT